VRVRPTMGFSSRSRTIPRALSQDVGGPLARTVTDAAIVLDATVGVDPDDPATNRSAGRIPSSYTMSLDRNGLRTARIGALLPLFGAQPDDARAGSVARTALRELESGGARVVDIAAGPLPSEGEVSVIRYEFKFDLDAYLRRTPRAPVRSLAEILDKGVYLKALEQAFRGSNAVATLDSDEYRSVVAKQTDLRRRMLALLEDNQIDALAYPTLRRTAAKIREPQAGGNCAAS